MYSIVTSETYRVAVKAVNTAKLEYNEHGYSEYTAITNGLYVLVVLSYLQLIRLFRCVIFA